MTKITRLRLPRLVAVLVACIVLPSAASAQIVREAAPLILVEGLESIPPSSGGVHSLLTEIVRANIPVDYENVKDWGQTKEVTRGIRIRREGLRLTTKRRKKAVNHGTWKRYNIHLIDPKQNLKLRVENYTEKPDHRVSMDLVIDAKLDATGRISKWERGLQLFSLSAAAQSDVQLRIRCDIGLVLDASEFPPAVAIDPVVTDANLLLRDFRLRELSNLRGSAARGLSSGVREIVEDVIEEKRARMVKKLNDKIDRSRDRLRLSFADMLKTPWADKVRQQPAATTSQPMDAETTPAETITTPTATPTTAATATAPPNATVESR